MMFVNSYTARYRYSNRQYSLTSCYLVLAVLVLSCCHHSSAKIPYINNLQWTKQIAKLPTFYRHKGIGINSRSLLTIRGGDSSINRWGGVDDWPVSSGDTISYGNNNKNEVTTNKQKQTTTPTSNTEQSPFEYIPITALNDYGQSTQLKNAMESASRFGTSVLACICCQDHEDEEDSTDQSKEEDRVENTIVVCSLQRPRPGVIATSPPTCSSSITTKTSSSKSTIHSSIQGMVRILSTRDDVHPNSIPYDSSMDIPKHTLHTAIVTTGIQSDANFLLTQLQMHISKYWFRYDTIPSTSSSDGTSSSVSSPSSTVTKMVRDVLLDCLGYDWSNEVNSGKVSGGIGSAAPSYNEQEDEDDRPQRAGRPLGVCTFLLGLDSSTEFPYLTVIKANGSSQQYVAHAMGRGSDLGNVLLSQKWRRGMTTSEAKDMMISVLKDIAKEQGWIREDDGEGSKGRDSDWVVSCETVSPSGIDIDIEHLEL